MRFSKFLPKILFLLFLALLLFGNKSALADSKEDVQKKIDELQAKITDLQGQERTLSSQIGVMNSQISLTELQISSTKQQINDLTLDIDTTTKKIGNIEKSLDNLTKVLINRVVATYEIGSAPSFQILATSNNVTDFVKRANYLRLAQAHDKRLIYDTVQAKNDYQNQKDIFEGKKEKVEALNTQLKAYSAQLDQEKASKQVLLSETQGSEANYQSLLAQAKAQLAGFSNFTQSQGGASLISGQTVCDDWGCYYNQRDSQWGGNSLNGTEYTLASDGCLVTAMAMVYTHYGHRGVTPATINSNSNNFASYYPAFLKTTIVADGATSQRVSSAIDSTLSTGNPVVVGVHAYGGTHFVVLISGSGGNYVMNDPYIANGSKISFNSHYSVGSIYEIDKINW